MKTKVSECPHCGAPIYVPSVWWAVVPPTPEYTCSCVKHPKTVTVTNLYIDTEEDSGNG